MRWWALIGAYVLAMCGAPQVFAGEQANSPLIKEIDEQIAQLVAQYPHLTLWNTMAAKEPMSCEGKRYLWDGRLRYQHAVPADGCRTEPTTFDRASCSLEIIAYTEDEWRRIEGSGVHTKIFGLEAGQYRIVADMWTDNPPGP